MDERCPRARGRERRCGGRGQPSDLHDRRLREQARRRAVKWSPSYPTDTPLRRNQTLQIKTPIPVANEPSRSANFKNGLSIVFLRHED
jgi:hypothetical protein